MLIDNQTNFLYLADSLLKKQPEFYARFEAVLKENKIDFDFLPQTKDIWAVDFMPTQVSDNKHVQFVYKPDYLQTKSLIKTISDVDYICDSLKMLRVKSDILLDGGNVIRSSKSVILCDKVFQENPHYTRKNLLTELRELFEVEKVILVPQQPKDIIGHADGMVRFLDENTVLVNDYSIEKPEFQRAFLIALDNAGLDYIEIPYNPYNNISDDDATGIYINYLQMKDVIFLPVFGLEEDEKAVNQIEKLFPAHKIVPVKSNEIAKEGGVLNCISWNIWKA